MVDFSTFNFDENEEWTAYLKRLDPEPKGQVLERRKQKWFKSNVDPTFTITIGATQRATAAKVKENETAPTTTDCVDEAADGTVLKSCFMMATCFMLLAAIPFLNRYEIPIFIGSGRISFLTAAVLCILSGYVTYITNRAETIKSIFTKYYLYELMISHQLIHILFAGNALLSMIWICAVAPYIGLFQIYSKSTEFKTLYGTVLEVYGPQMSKNMTQSQKDAFLKDVLFVKMDALIARTELVSVIVVMIMAIVNFPVHSMSLITNVMLFRCSYIHSSVVREETSAMNSSLIQKLPSAIRIHYVKFCDAIHKYVVPNTV